METYLVAYTDKDDMEYKQVTCESYEDAERTVLRLEREGHMHIEEISNQEAYRGDESSYREWFLNRNIKLKMKKQLLLHFFYSI